MLECVVNISEGRNHQIIERLSDACGIGLLDVHSDAEHHRSVFTLGGDTVESAVRSLCECALFAVDLSQHSGAHPRLVSVDVVPFVPLGATTWSDAVRARDAFAQWWSTAHQVPTFLYGESRTLPEIRKHAFVDLDPDYGPSAPHPTVGATAAGVRGVLVAYNLWLDGSSRNAAREIARSIRSDSVRALALELDGHWQVSCNLIEPSAVGPVDVYDAVAQRADIARAELVGLLPEAVLQTQPRERWTQLDVGPEVTIEARLRETGLDEGKI